jgi:hypothetical protein
MTPDKASSPKQRGYLEKPWNEKALKGTVYEDVPETSRTKETW